MLQNKANSKVLRSYLCSYFCSCVMWGFGLQNDSPREILASNEKVSRFAAKGVNLSPGRSRGLLGKSGNFWATSGLLSRDQETRRDPEIYGSQNRHEKGTQTQTFKSGYFSAGRGLLPLERVGGQKSSVCLSKPGNQTFLAGYPGILPGYYRAQNDYTHIL